MASFVVLTHLPPMASSSSYSQLHFPRHGSATSLLRPLPIPISNRIKVTPLIGAVRTVRCSSSRSEGSPFPLPLPPPESPIGRRSSLVAFLLSQGVAFCPAGAVAASFLDKYVKRKKLEPLESYVPAVLLTQVQFKNLEKSLDSEEVNYENTRYLLRAGPAASLRVNIRAVAQYAEDGGKGKTASDSVDRCLRAIEDLDSLLLHASRNDPSARVDSMKTQINVAMGALDGLLQTVPASVLDKGKEIADVYLTPSDANEVNYGKDDKDLKELEDILR